MYYYASENIPLNSGPAPQGFIQRGVGPVIPFPRTIYQITILNMLALCDMTTKGGGLYDTIVLNHVITIAEIKIQMPVIIICHTITEFVDFLFKNFKNFFEVN